MNYIKERYELPFLEIGMKVEADGKPGSIEREKKGYIEVKFDNGKTGLAHPTWEMVYFDENGQIIKDFRKRKESNNTENSIHVVRDSSVMLSESSGLFEAIQNDFQNSTESFSEFNTSAQSFSGFGGDDGGSFGGGGASGSWDSSSDSNSYDSSSDY